ncbi:MAG: MFS transporter [Candidatus Sumerlaeia bacterium]|nr:MFS transporter [Candidatus Sumerlaeia bacterium]
MTGTGNGGELINDDAPHKDGMRTYIAMVGTMFQGAFSDNVFRFIMTMLVLDVANEMAATSEEGILLGARYQLYIGLALALPWILAANVAGWMSNRFSKSRVTQATKVMEIGVMGVACLALGMGSVWFGILTFFLMMLQSAFFGPSKYGILPEILAKSRVTWGNGVMQGCTFFAIILGTIVGPWLYGEFKEVLWVTGLLLVGCATVGLVTSMAMAPVPAANPKEKLDINPFAPLVRYGKQILIHRGLTATMLANTVFWSVGLMLQLAAIQILKNIMKLPDAQVGFGLVPIVVGNGVGCFLVGMLCRKNIKLWLVPIGGFFIALTGMLTWMVTPLAGTIEANGGELPGQLVWGIPLAMGLVGLSCGAYVVPLQSYILGASPSEYRGGIWATGNMLTAVGWIIGSQAFDMIMNLRGNPGDVFLAGGLVVFLAAIVTGIFFRELFSGAVPRQMTNE